MPTSLPTRRSSDLNSYVWTGGGFTGTHAYANGTKNFSPAAIGNVTQVADLAITVTVTGSIFGNVNSTAGNAGAARSGSEYSSSGTTVLDLDGSGTYVAEYDQKSESTPISGGDSTVVVSGQVARRNAGGSANIYSQGANSTPVTITGWVDRK